MKPALETTSAGEDENRPYEPLSEEEREDEEDDERHEEQLRYRGRDAGDATKTKERSDERDDREDEKGFEHDGAQREGGSWVREGRQARAPALPFNPDCPVGLHRSSIRLHRTIPYPIGTSTR